MRQKHEGRTLWQAFEREGKERNAKHETQNAPHVSLVPKTPFHFGFLPFPSLSNACHAGYFERELSLFVINTAVSSCGTEYFFLWDT